jgi:hypothetical protein
MRHIFSEVKIEAWSQHDTLSKRKGSFVHQHIYMETNRSLEYIRTRTDRGTLIGRNYVQYFQLGENGSMDTSKEGKLRL